MKHNLAIKYRKLCLFVLALAVAAFSTEAAAQNVEYNVSAEHDSKAQTLAGRMEIRFSSEVLDEDGNLLLMLYANRFSTAFSDPKSKEMRRAYPYNFNPGFTTVHRAVEPQGQNLKVELLEDRQKNKDCILKIHLPKPAPARVNLTFTTRVPKRLGIFGKMDNTLIAFNGFYPLVVDSKNGSISLAEHRVHLKIPEDIQLVLASPGSSVANDTNEGLTTYYLAAVDTQKIGLFLCRKNCKQENFYVGGVKVKLVTDTDNRKQSKKLRIMLRRIIRFYNLHVDIDNISEIKLVPFYADKYLIYSGSGIVAYDIHLFKTFNYFYKFQETALAEQVYRVLLESAFAADGAGVPNELLVILSRYIAEEYALSQYGKIPDATYFFNALQLFVEVNEDNILPDIPFRETYFRKPVDKTADPRNLDLYLFGEPDKEVTAIFRNILKHDETGSYYFDLLIRILKRWNMLRQSEEDLREMMEMLAKQPEVKDQKEAPQDKDQKTTVQLQKLMVKMGLSGRVDARGLGLYMKQSYELKENQPIPGELLPEFILPRYVRQPFHLMVSRSRLSFELPDGEPKFRTELSFYRQNNVRDHLSLSGEISPDLLDLGLGYSFNFGDEVTSLRREFRLTPKVVYRRYFDVDTLPGEIPEIYAFAVDFTWDTVIDHFYFLNDHMLNLSAEVASSDVLGKYDYEKFEFKYQHNFRPAEKISYSIRTGAGVFADFPPSFILFDYKDFLKAVAPKDDDKRGEKYISLSPQVSFLVKDRLWISLLRVFYLKRAFLNVFWESGVLEAGSFDSDTLDTLRHDVGPELQFDCDIFGVAPGVIKVGAAVPTNEPTFENSVVYIYINGQF